MRRSRTQNHCGCGGDDDGDDAAAPLPARHARHMRLGPLSRSPSTARYADAGPLTHDAREWSEVRTSLAAARSASSPASCAHAV